MKRVLVRLSALAGIVVLGLIAIAQAQRSMKDSQKQQAKSDAAAVKSDDPGQLANQDAGATRDVGEPHVNHFADEPVVRRTLDDVGPAPAYNDSSVPSSESIGSEAPEPWDQGNRYADRAVPMDNADDDDFPTADDVLGSAAGGNVVRAQTGADLQPTAGSSGSARRYPAEPQERRGSAELSQQDTFSESSPTSDNRSADFDQVSETGLSSLTATTGGRHAEIDERYPDPSGPSEYTPQSAGSVPGAFPDANASLAERIADGRGAAGTEAYDRSGGGDSLPPLVVDRLSGSEPLGDASYGEGTGRPGNQRLEGMQAPSLSVEKIAPAEVQVGSTAVFEIRVRNTGTVAAQDVEVQDLVPKGTRLVGTEPRANRGNNGELIWSLGTLEPGEETRLEVQLMPISEGEIGSVATVQFRANASVRTSATRPELVLEISAASEVMIGDELTYDIKVANVGSGTATGIVLVEHLPENLEHPAGDELEYDIGTLNPDESREVRLTMRAVSPGPVHDMITVEGDGNIRVEEPVELEVIAPALELAIQGPKKRYLERQATYTVSVSNPGSAAAKEVELVTYLPPGMKFIEADNYGHYDAETRAVYWLLEELPARETGSVMLVALPVEIGEHTLRFEGAAEQGLSVKQEQTVRVEGVAAILFEVVDVEDPVEVGAETTYEIRVVNQGTKTATNVQLEALLPAAMQVVAAEGPSRYVVQQGRVIFDPLARLAPKADTAYRIRVRTLEPGDMRIRVHLKTDDMSTPVTKEESTRVYADE